jgi:TctA family transporter
LDARLVEAFFAGLMSLLQWPTFGLLLLGIVIGFIVGMLPGLGGPVTLALMLPLTFDMQPVGAFAFLIGMLSVTATTGDITSILFGVPGEATSAALVVDGHPLAKQGQAGRALGAALMSSLIGAVVGAFALALSIPFVRPLVLSFGSPEFFMLSVLGISFVASLSGGAAMKGLIAGGLGLMLSSIGRDPQSGIERFTFGSLYLWDGIGLVPLSVGLFAIPEIVDLALKGNSIAQQPLGKLGGVMQGVGDTFRHIWLTLRCSLVGTFLGLVPGLGGSVAQWLAYSHAVQSTRDKSRFGKGAIQGVLGPGAANNSKEGASLIPTIAFGIPGGLNTAILLGAFMLHGLVPGPSMLTTHLNLTMSFVWMVVIANIITVAVCFMFVGQLARLTAIRAGLLIPCIILLVYIGAFAENNKVLDLPMTLLFGALGLLMVRLGWPRPPLVLGLVLGTLAENYLYLSTNRYGAEWLARPIVIVLLAVLVASLTIPLLRRALARRTAGSPVVSATAAETPSHV